MKEGFLVIAALMILFPAGCSKGTRTSQLTTLTGTLKIVGNAPFTHLVLTVGEHPESAEAFCDYLITGALEKELREKYQYRKVTLEGYTCNPPSPQFAHCFNPTRLMNAE